jgi:hypothetical protein
MSKGGELRKQPERYAKLPQNCCKNIKKYSIA